MTETNTETPSTVRAAFAPEEWDILRGVPREAAIAAAIADPDGSFGATKAIVAAFKELVAGTTEFPGNALIAELLLELRTGSEGPEDQDETLELDEAERDRRLAETLDRARAANALLAAKADPTAAEEYRRWVVRIARKAVRSAKSGGFLGIGGERVTETEAAFVADLRAALGVSA
jgi:hypothetical protein